MSIEPTCNFCGYSDKLRCKSQKAANECIQFKDQQRIKSMMKFENKEEIMSKTTEQLAELSGRTSRSIIAVIDAMCQRGAFKGEELLTIGQLRSDCAQVTQLSEAVTNEISEGQEDKA